MVPRSPQGALLFWAFGLADDLPDLGEVKPQRADSLGIHGGVMG